MGAARVRNVLTRIVTAAACLAIVAFATAGDARTPPITQTSIGGAKLGLSASAYKRLLGKPNFKLPLNDPAKKNAIHGFACRRSWRVVGQGVEQVLAPMDDVCSPDVV